MSSVKGNSLQFLEIQQKSESQAPLLSLPWAFADRTSCAPVTQPRLSFRHCSMARELRVTSASAGELS